MSSYPSKAYGKLTLAGKWTQEAIQLLEPVLSSWEIIDNESGLWVKYIPTMNSLTIPFDGSGWGGFTGLLEDLDKWTRECITKPKKGEKCKLNLETYEALLSIMHENDLCIALDFSDESCGDSEWDECTEYFTGKLTSDGKKLNYCETSCRQETWEDLGEEALDGAVDFFSRFITVPDEEKIRAWIIQNVPASKQVAYLGDELDEDLYFDVILSMIEHVFESFQKIFSPDTEVWMRFNCAKMDMYGDDESEW